MGNSYTDSLKIKSFKYGLSDPESSLFSLTMPGMLKVSLTQVGLKSPLWLGCQQLEYTEADLPGTLIIQLETDVA